MYSKCAASRSSSAWRLIQIQTEFPDEQEPWTMIFKQVREFPSHMTTQTHVIRIGFFHERRQQQRAMWENSEALCTTASRPEQGRTRTRTGRLRDGMAVAAEDAAPSIPLNGSFPRSLPKQIKIRRAFIRHKKGTVASLLVSFALEQNSTRLKHCIMWGHFHMMSAQGKAPSRWSEGGIIHTSIKYRPIGKGSAWIAELNVVI